MSEVETGNNVDSEDEFQEVPLLGLPAGQGPRW